MITDSPNSLGLYASFVGLFCVFALVYLVAKQRTKGALKVWLVSGIVGALIGATAVFVCSRVMGIEFVSYAEEDGAEMSAEGEEGGGPGGGPRGGGGGGGGGGFGGGGGGRGGFQPSPSRELTSLVRKLDLLTGDIALELTADQKTTLASMLAAIQEKEAISDEEAADMRDELNGHLTEAQKAVLEKVGLPRTRGRRGGGGDDGGNPFAEGDNAEAIQRLVEQLK